MTLWSNNPDQPDHHPDCPYHEDAKCIHYERNKDLADDYADYRCDDGWINAEGETWACEADNCPAWTPCTCSEIIESLKADNAGV